MPPGRRHQYNKAESQTTLTSAAAPTPLSAAQRTYSSSSSSTNGRAAGGGGGGAKAGSVSRGASEDHAMDMEIQQVPWWNRRSRMERRFFVAAVLLLCLSVGLAVGLAAVLFKSSRGADESSASSITSPMTKPVNGHAIGGGGVGSSASTAEGRFCMTKGCVKTAADILDNMDQSVDPCVDFYKFACGGFMDRTSIPDDRTRMSSFSVLGDELLTQVGRIFYCFCNLQNCN